MDDWFDDFESVPHAATASSSQTDQQEAYASQVQVYEDVDETDVIERIESYILAFLEEVFLHGAAPDISLGTAPTRNGEQERVRKLMHRQGQGAYPYARIFAILQISHELLCLGVTASQRDVFYRLKTLDIFSSPEQVNQAIQDAAAMLGMARSALGICCASRGSVYGALRFREAPNAPWLTCSDCPRSIPGDSRAFARLTYDSSCRFVIVVEKDAIFQRLVEDGFAENTESILVTAKGMPDMATRAFLHSLCSALPHLQQFAVVDWNPSGLSIFSIYKHGSPDRRESHCLPDLQWLAARAEMLHGVPDIALQGPLTGRDKALMSSLKAGKLQKDESIVAELDAMLEMDAKAEIEALYDLVGIDSFSEALAHDLMMMAEEGLRLPVKSTVCAQA